MSYTKARQAIKRSRGIRMKECFYSIFDNIIIKILLCILAVLVSLGIIFGLSLLWVIWLVNYTASCVIITLSILGIIAFAELVYLAYVVFFDE